MFRETGSGPSFREWEHGKGYSRLDWTANGATRFRVVGEAHKNVVPYLLEHWNSMLQVSAKLTILFDAWELDSYDSEVRVGPTQWLRDHRANVSAIHVSMRSKLVAMGVSVANLALGSVIQVYTTRLDFDRVVKSLGLPLETKRASRNPVAL